MSGAIFRFQVRAYYEDTDASGVVYHANYLRWFERARTEWLRALGFEQAQLAETLGAVFTVARLEIAYRRPARLDDRLEAELQVTAVGGASIEFEQALCRVEGGERLATARVKVGCVDASSFRPTAVPKALRAAMEGWSSTA